MKCLSAGGRHCTASPERAHCDAHERLLLRGFGPPPVAPRTVLRLSAADPMVLAIQAELASRRAGVVA